MGKIHAVSTQGMFLGLILAALAGFGLGQVIKTGRRVSTSEALKS